MNIEIGAQSPLDVEVGLAKAFAENKETTTEEYMRICDYLEYPTPWDEKNYTVEEIEKCQNLVDFYTRMEE